MKSYWRSILSKKMLVALLMGFSCGLPLLLTITVLQAWMHEVGVDIKVIGLFSLVGLPYTLKFLWAPVLDRFSLPLFGRRRGWLLLCQILLMLAIAGLGFTNPLASPYLVAGVAFLVTFFSASQDIVVDAYRREDLTDNELGLGSSLYVNGYRLGMLVAGSGGLIMADHISFQMVYLILSVTMLIGVITTICCREPEISVGTPTTFKEAVIGPFVDYFSRPGAWLLLAFILFYKIGDQMATTMTMPFYLELGFSKTEIGTVVKLFGFWATIGGGLVGGIILLKLGISRSLWIFGILQAVSTSGFAVLANVGASLPLLAGVIACENFSGGMGTAAYVAYMASLTNKKFTATQYALLSSLMGIPRVLAAAPTGYAVSALGWSSFFIFCTVAALPGLLLLVWINRNERQSVACF